MMQGSFFRFASPLALVVLPVVVVVFWLRLKKRVVSYRYSQTHLLIADNNSSGEFFKNSMIGMRLVALMVLALLCARPQLVDEHSKLPTQGIDIVLVLDVSGSMQEQDNIKDNRSRFEIAKQEAARFISKRDNDAIGLVLFGNVATFRCPITMDKKLLLELVSSLQLGEIDHKGTVLARGMMAAVNRLKESKAASKIMILLTDGEPTEEDLDPHAALEIVKKFGIKVYAIGIGSEQEKECFDMQQGYCTRITINKKLLEMIASQTGGQCFMAHNASDMRTIYDTIDQLEKTKQEMPMFVNFHDLMMPFLFVVVGLMFIELCLSTFIWFGI